MAGAVLPLMRERERRDGPHRARAGQGARADRDPGNRVHRPVPGVPLPHLLKGALLEVFRGGRVRLPFGRRAQESLHVARAVLLLGVPLPGIQRCHAPQPFTSRSFEKGPSAGRRLSTGVGSRSSSDSDSRCRPARTRLRTVASGEPSSRATSARLNPSK